MKVAATVKIQFTNNGVKMQTKFVFECVRSFY
jgi:hypothetical protein